MTSIRRLGWTAFALFALAGCEPATPLAPAPGPAPSPATELPKAPSETKALPVEPAKPEEPKKEGAALPKLSEEEIAEIKKLPADEQAIAMEQVICPVGKDHLGEMGMPIKQVVDGKTFFLCCSGCEKKVKSDPAGVLAELARQKK